MPAQSGSWTVHRRTSAGAALAAMALVASSVPAVRVQLDGDSLEPAATTVAPTTTIDPATVFVRPEVDGLRFDLQPLGEVGWETGIELHVLAADRIFVADVDDNSLGEIRPHPLAFSIQDQPLLDGIEVVMSTGDSVRRFDPFTWRDLGAADELQTTRLTTVDPTSSVSASGLVRWQRNQAGVWFVETSDGERVGAVPLSHDGLGEPLMAAWSPDGTTIVYARTDALGVQLFNPELGVSATVWVGEPIRGVIVLPAAG